MGVISHTFCNLFCSILPKHYPIIIILNHCYCKSLMNGVCVLHTQKVFPFHELAIRKTAAETKTYMPLSCNARYCLWLEVNFQFPLIGASFFFQYSKFVKPAFDDFILPTKKYADIIIPRGGDNHVAIDLIVQHIRTKLGQHDLCKIYPNLYVIQSTFQVLCRNWLINVFLFPWSILY